MSFSVIASVFELDDAQQQTSMHVGNCCGKMRVALSSSNFHVVYADGKASVELVTQLDVATARAMAEKMLAACDEQDDLDERNRETEEEYQARLGSERRSRFLRSSPGVGKRHDDI